MLFRFASAAVLRTRALSAIAATAFVQFILVAILIATAAESAHVLALRDVQRTSLERIAYLGLRGHDGHAGPAWRAELAFEIDALAPIELGAPAPEVRRFAGAARSLAADPADAGALERLLAARPAASAQVIADARRTSERASAIGEGVVAGLLAGMLFQMMALAIVWRHDERAHAAARLHSTEASTLLLLDSLPAVIGAWDANLRNEFGNRAYRHYFRTSPELMRGRQWRLVVGEDFYAENLAHAERALAGEAQAFEREIVDVMGRRRHILIEFVPKTERDAPNGFFEHMTDITPRKLAENALFEEKERARVTLSAIVEAVIATDAGGIVTFMNPAAEPLVGMSAAGAIGTAVEAVMSLVDDATGEPIEHPIKRAIAGGEPVAVRFETSLVTADRRCVAIDLSAAPLHDQAGAVTGAVIVFRDVSVTRAQSRKLAKQINHDSLTGLWNRVEFARKADSLVESARRNGETHALLYLDLDGFKAVNDTGGHLAGDELLRGLARAMAARLRRPDVLARLGGDEFAILLPGCPLDVAREIAGELITAVNRFQLKWGSRTLGVTVSIGVAQIVDGAADATASLRAADRACYRAKTGGRNRIDVARPGDYLPGFALDEAM